jgi:hypothetical protein
VVFSLICFFAFLNAKIHSAIFSFFCVYLLRIALLLHRLGFFARELLISRPDDGSSDVSILLFLVLLPLNHGVKTTSMLYDKYGLKKIVLYFKGFE